MVDNIYINKISYLYKEEIMKKLYRLTAGAICIAMLAGCGGGKKGMPGDMPPGMGQQAATTSVEIENPRIETVKDEYKYTGTMAAKEEVDITSKVSGKVTKVNADIGDYVEKGSVLFTIDTTDIENSINTSRANLKTNDASIAAAKTNLELANGSSAQSQLANAKNQVTNAESTIESKKYALEQAQTSLETAEASLASQKISLDKAQEDYDTNKALYDVGGVSKEVLDNSSNALEQAKNSYTQQENAVKNAQTQLSNAQLSLEDAQTAYSQAVENYKIAQQAPEENVRKAQDSLNSAIASRASIEAQIKTNESNLKDYTITSPISGYVTAKNVTEGAMFSGVAYTVCDTSTVDIEVAVSEDIETKVKVNDDVRIFVPSISDDEMEGKITEINPGANTDGTYTIKVNMDNKEGLYKSGLYAEVYFAKSTSKNALTLTRNSVLHSNEEYYVFVENDGTVEKRIVTVGIDTGERIEVTGGISASDRVVSKGQNYLKDGDQVNVVAENGVDITSDTNSQSSSMEPQGDRPAGGEMPDDGKNKPSDENAENPPKDREGRK